MESQEESKVKQVILNSLIQLTKTKNLHDITIKEVRVASQVSPDDFFKHFTYKEDILLFYYEQVFDATIERLAEYEDFISLSLKEQIYIFFDLLFQEYAKNQDFTIIATKRLLLNPFRNLQGLVTYRNQFLEVIQDLLEAAVDVEEIGDSALSSKVYYFFWEYYLSLLGFWISDDSVEKQQTKEILEQSLELINGALVTDVVGKSINLLHFLFRNHILKRVDPQRIGQVIELLDKLGFSILKTHEFRPTESEQ
ncbi:MAG: AcrR family transcriptional regulator [bacterium]|jgi:AcrR family transcriptional regulator